MQDCNNIFAIYMCKPMEHMVVDLLTKPSDSTFFLSHVRALGLCNWWCKCTIL